MIRRITGDTFTLKQLFESAVYRIDYYQREYAWSADDVRTLVNDLLHQFQETWQDGRRSRRPQEPFFLGPFVYSEERAGIRFLVDGQQRFTTLHLIFVHLRRLAQGFRKRDTIDRLSRVILDFGTRGSRKLRVDIDERRAALLALYDSRAYEVPRGASLSLINLWSRSSQIAEILDESLTADACPHFVEWLLNHVVLVGIQAPSRDSGYRIFESMNDRGARLTPVDLVKSFLLSNVGMGEEELNIAWRRMLAEVTTIRDDTDAPKRFLRAVLLGRYAQVGEADERDAREIDTSLNTWVRRHSEQRLGLRRSDDYLRFVEDLIELSKHYVTFLRATRKLHADHGLAALFYNDTNGLTNQMELILAAVRPQDTSTEAKAKAALVANYLDRLFVIRVLNDEPVDARDFNTDVRRLIPLLRDCAASTDIAKVLATEIADETFESALTFGARGNNTARVRYILARLTAYTDVGCGGKDRTEEFLAGDQVWQIEHLWPNHAAWYQAEEADPLIFRLLRSRLGGLGLLHRRDNATLKDMPFADKVSRYARQNNLLAILSPGHRKNNTFVRDFAKLNKVESYFRDFGANPTMRTVIEGRAELLRRLCLRIWDPQALGFPVQPKVTVERPEPSSGPSDPVATSAGDSRARPRVKLRTDVARMVRAGVIEPGAKIVLAHNAVDHFATINADGLTCFPTGDSFSKLDDAGMMITQKRCDGLGEWCLLLADGDRIAVRELRDRAWAR